MRNYFCSAKYCKILKSQVRILYPPVFTIFEALTLYENNFRGIDMKNKAIYILCAFCLAMTACGKTVDTSQESMTEETTVTEETETETAPETTTAAPTETTVITTTRPTPVTTFDENDEILVRGQEFAESYAKMYWDYLCGAAWEDYLDTPYFDFDDKSEGNYFEDDGNMPDAEGVTFDPIPYYKLLITDYTYDELIAYIKSFYSDELFEEFKQNYLINGLFTGRDNCIYVNGNEPTFIYQMRNEHAHIIGYTENDDGSVTYDCFAKTTEEDDDDLYFSFTLNADGKLCADVYDAELGLFSDTYYCDDET